MLLQAAARVVLVGDRGPLAGQLEREPRPLQPRLIRRAIPREPLPPGPASRSGCRGSCLLPPWPIHQDGGILRSPRYRRPHAGRTANTCLRSKPRPHAPLFRPNPWINVDRQPAVGFLISEGGSGFTWAVNSQANRLTPWSNDPVTDRPGEIVYLRDEKTGEIWSPTPHQHSASARHSALSISVRSPRAGLHALRAALPRARPMS